MLDDKCFVFLNLLHCVSINFIKKRKKTLIEGEKVVEWMDNASCRRTESHLRRLEIVCTETLHLLPHPLFQRLPKTSKSTPLFTSSHAPPIALLIISSLSPNAPSPPLPLSKTSNPPNPPPPSPHHRGPSPPSLSQSKTSQIHSSFHLFPHSFAHSYLSPNPLSPPPFLSFFSPSAS